MADVHIALPEKPFYLQAPGSDTPIAYTAEEFRRHDSAVFHKAGVLTPTSFKITQSPVVGWSVQVNSGWAVLGTTFEKYVITSSAATTISLSSFNTSPPGTRTHRIWLCVFDHSYSGTLTGQAQIVATEDTTGTGASAPSEARFSLLLANVFISPGQSNIQTNNISTGSTVRIGGYDGYTLSGTNALSLSTGVVDATSETNTALINTSIRNGMVHLGGAVMRAQGSSTRPVWTGSNTYPIGVLPIDLAPQSYKVFSLAGGPNTAGSDQQANAYSYRLVVTNNRQIFADVPTGYSPYYLYFDGASWALDI